MGSLQTTTNSFHDHEIHTIMYKEQMRSLIQNTVQHKSFTVTNCQVLMCNATQDKMRTSRIVGHENA